MARQMQTDRSGDIDRLAVRRDPLVATVERALRERCGVEAAVPGEAGSHPSPLPPPDWGEGVNPAEESPHPNPLPRGEGVNPGAGAGIVVGVSGGPDSMALLLALDAIASRGDGCPGLLLHPVCVHHHLRDETDEEVVAATGLCGALGLPLEVVHVNPAQEAGNLAANARRLRYEAMVGHAQNVGVGAIAVGHHADDQFETILMALCRGAGARGLAGMAWRRVLSDGIALVRPLLGVGKADCERLCSLAGVKWCVDASNQSPGTVRGRLRREVIPVLEAMWPGCAMRAQQAAEVMDDASVQHEAIVVEAFGGPGTVQWERADLARWDERILAAGLARRVEELTGGRIGGSVDAGVLREAARAIRSDDVRPKQFQVGDGWNIEVTSRRVMLVNHNDNLAQDDRDTAGSSPSREGGS